jgi:hypothetical protein
VRLYHISRWKNEEGIQQEIKNIGDKKKKESLRGKLEWH